MANLNDKSVEELRELARERDVAGRSSMNKDDLVKALESDESSDEKDAASREAEREADAPTVEELTDPEFEDRDEDKDDSEPLRDFERAESNLDNPAVVEALSEQGKEAAESLEDEQAHLADAALDARGPLLLGRPEDRLATGAVNEEHAKELAEIIGDHEVSDEGGRSAGDVTEAGPEGRGRREARDVHGDPIEEHGTEDAADGEETRQTVRPEDVIDYDAYHGGGRAAAQSGPYLDSNFTYVQVGQLYTDGLSGAAERTEAAYAMPELRAKPETEEAYRVAGSAPGDGDEKPFEDSVSEGITAALEARAGLDLGAKAE